MKTRFPTFRANICKVIGCWVTTLWAARHKRVIRDKRAGDESGKHELRDDSRNKKEPEEVQQHCCGADAEREGVGIRLTRLGIPRMSSSGFE